MAVVIDLPFWKSLGSMRQAGHLSNCDIVWFVVQYTKEADGTFQLEPYKAFYTTLENAVEGLTGGIPVPLDHFEAAIREKLGRA